MTATHIQILLRGCFFACLLFVILPAHGQQEKASWQLEVVVTDQEALPRQVSYKTTHRDSVAVRLELRNMVLTLRQLSYIMASVDSVHATGTDITAYVYLGDPFKWASLTRGNVDEGMLSKVGFREKYYNNKPFTYREFLRLQKRIIDYSVDHGRPFAQIRLDSIEIRQGKVRAVLDYDEGPEILFDSIVIKGSAKVKERFLARYLKIVPDKPFNQSRVDQIPRLLKQLPYISIKQAPELVFRRDKAVVYLFIDDKKANHFDGILGVLPNEQEQGKVLITGELNVGLRNLFNTGKSFTAEWKKIEQNSQTLDIQYYHPELFGSNLDVTTDFSLLKEDTIFISLERRLELSSDIGRIGVIGAYVSLNTSRLLLDEDVLGGLAVLPDVSDFDYLTYGLTYLWQNLDDFFFPKRGFKVTIETGIGNKTIRQNPFIEEELYEDIELKTVQVFASARIEKHTRVGKKSVFYSRLFGGYIMNENLFVNDLFRIGGLTTLRGFNQNFFFSDAFSVLTLEYRFFTSQTSYLFLFTDQGYVRNSLRATNEDEYAAGVGMGISFDTNVGVFNLAFSVGRSNEQEFSFNLAKIHFGLVSRF